MKPLSNQPFVFFFIHTIISSFHVCCFHAVWSQEGLVSKLTHQTDRPVTWAPTGSCLFSIPLIFSSSTFVARGALLPHSCQRHSELCTPVLGVSGGGYDCDWQANYHIVATVTLDFAAAAMKGKVMWCMQHWKKKAYLRPKIKSIFFNSFSCQTCCSPLFQLSNHSTPPPKPPVATWPHDLSFTGPFP